MMMAANILGPYIWAEDTTLSIKFCIFIFLNLCAIESIENPAMIWD